MCRVECKKENQMTSLYQQYRVLLNSALCKARVNCLIPERSSAAFLCRVPSILTFHLILSLPRVVECSGCKMPWQHPVNMRETNNCLIEIKTQKPSNVSAFSLNVYRLTHFFLYWLGSQSFIYIVIQFSGAVFWVNA